MVANMNRLAAWVKLIPRADYPGQANKQQNNRIYGEFGEQAGAPFGLYRAFIFSLCYWRAIASGIIGGDYANSLHSRSSG